MSVESGALVVSGLSKAYGLKRRVVDDVSFDCRRGSVTGFVGPNGSGKSTTLRMIVGHTRPSAGSALFDGVPLSDLPSPGATVGVLLDASAHHPGRSVFETAYLSALLIGVGRRRVRDCLDAVGIYSVRAARVGTLSLGMRQRLGVALAVLGSPDFLILDEPANGLDPEGIHWLREFLRAFAENGGCALVSSHQLGELEAASDSIVAIDRGTIRDMDGCSPAAPLSRVTCDDDARLRLMLETVGVTVRNSQDGHGLLVGAEPEAIFAHAVEAGVVLHLLVSERDTLESRFLRATSGEFAGLAGDRLAEVFAEGRS